MIDMVIEHIEKFVGVHDNTIKVNNDLALQTEDGLETVDIFGTDYGFHQWAAEQFEEDQPYKIIYPNGDVRWYLNAILHREIGPACIFASGGMHWILNGDFGRNDQGPTVIGSEGSEEWHVNGLLHREDGPARIYPDNYMSWWIDGTEQKTAYYNRETNTWE